jgi:transmembrane sensor
MLMNRASRIEQEAADWLARRDARPWSDADRAAFDEWLGASPIHKVEFLRMEYAWEESLRLKALGAGVQSNKAPRPGRWVLSGLFGGGLAGRSGRMPAAPATRRFRLPTALAAGVLIAAAGAAAAWFTASHYGGRYSTAVGRLAHIAMADGSQVTLNTDSVVRVAVNTTERRVDLQRGEAFFKVAKDPSRPFIVTVGEQRVVAVGTQFSVRREGTDAQIVVTEGTVRIETGETSNPAAAVSAGSIAHAGRAGTSIQSRPLAQAEELISWRSGILVLHDMTLAEAAAEFNRYNARKIVIRDPLVSAMRISGSFRATNAEAFVRLLERGYPLQADTVNADIILTQR